MSGAQRLSIVGVEFAEPEKRRPNWVPIVIGASIAFLAHAAVFLILVAFQKYEPRPISYSHSVTALPALENEMSWEVLRPIISSKPGPHSAFPVVIEKWPIQTSVANLASIEIIDPDDEEDEFDLMGWFGPSMEF